MRRDGSHVDMRVVKTRLAIRAAVKDLLFEKDVAQITAKDVAETALISKKTFYAHYSGVYEVLEEMEGEAVSSIDEAMGKVDVLRDRRALGNVVSCIATIAGDRSSELGCLLHTRVRDELLGRIRGLVAERILSGATSATGSARRHVQYAATYVAGGVMSVFQQWLSSGQESSVDEIADVMSSIAAGGMDAIADGRA